MAGPVAESRIDAPGGSRGAQTYTLLLCTALYMMMYLDRNIINLLLESIKTDLELSDTVLALIAGFGFSLFHTLVGLPAARWADKGDRKLLITVTTAMWASMTMLCGMAQNGLQLALARIGVGIGESSAPVLHAVLSDNSTKDTRARLLSIMMMGGPLAALVCYPIVGWVEGRYGWRAAFMVGGVPGLMLAVLVWFTFKDRVRDAARKSAAGIDQSQPLKEVLSFFLRQRTFVLVVVGYVLSQVGILGFMTWAPTLLRRVHGMGAAQGGISFGVITGLLGLAGGLTAAFVMERTAKHGDKWKVLLPALATFLAAPSIVLATATASSSLTLFAQGLVAFMAAFKFGPIVAVNQSVVKPRMRSLASSIQGLTGSIIAVGGGPLYVGLLSDRLQPQHGVDGLRFALMTCAGFTVVGSIILALASRTVAADIARAEGRGD